MQTTFQTASGRRITGSLKSGNETLLIVCHGYRSSPDHPAITLITDKLNQEGYATFAFSFTSDPIDISGHTADILEIIKHFKDFRRVVLLSASLGSLSASLAAAQTPGLGGLVTLNGFFGRWDLGPAFFREFALFRLASAFSAKYNKIWRYFRRNFQPGLISAPVLVMHSPDDGEVKIGQSRYFFSKLQSPKVFKELRLKDHDLTDPADAGLIAGEVSRWLSASMLSQQPRPRQRRPPASSQRQS